MNQLDTLKQAYILASEDIIRLRLTIETKYKTESKIEKAERLAKSIHKIIDAHLHGCSKEEKELVRTKLVERHLLQNRSPITKLSIFNELIELDSKLEALQNRLEEWLKFQGYREITTCEILNHVHRHRIGELIEAKEEDLKSEAITELDSPPDKAASSFSLKKILKPVLGIGIITLTFLSFIYYYSDITRTKAPMISFSLMQIHSDVKSTYFIEQDEVASDRIPLYFEYRNISRQSLVSYLELKNSKLIEGQYLNVLYRIADEYQLNPLLLLAIIGHEQGFVPHNHQAADRIINNPYNVYGSWKSYNTNFEDATRIASKTIIKSLESRPASEDPFVWLNATYAEDDHWWKGVKMIFKSMDKETSQ